MIQLTRTHFIIFVGIMYSFLSCASDGPGRHSGRLLSARSRKEIKNSTGFGYDIPCAYRSSRYACLGMGETYVDEFKRKQESSSLCVVSIGNTFKDYTEKNDASTLFSIALFNQYKNYVQDNEKSSVWNIHLFNTYTGSKQINYHSTRCVNISIGESIRLFYNPDQDKNSTHPTLSISRKMLGMLCVISVGIKYLPCGLIMGIAAPLISSPINLLMSSGGISFLLILFALRGM